MPAPSASTFPAVWLRPTRLLPLVVLLLLTYICFFPTASHNHSRIFRELDPAQQYLAHHGPAAGGFSPGLAQQPARLHVIDKSDCPALPGIDDVFVILKTGASEAHKKLPIHFATTLKCLPNYAVFSDYDEEVAGHAVHDSLDEVNRVIATQNREFDLYRRLKKDGKTTIRPEDVGVNSAGWKLDKWKFLPITTKVWRDHPMTPWFVFIEDDTYISWPNLLYYLSKLNSSEPHYVGAQMQIDSVIFAHGGSGFAVSNEAMRLAVQRRRGNIEYYDGYTASHWAGDCVLGQLMDDVGSPVHWAWPNFQGQTPATMGANAAGYEGDPWCNAAITFHHMSTIEIEQMWRFERRLEKLPARDPLTYIMVLRELVWPEIQRMGPVAKGWDNQADGVDTDLSTAKAGSTSDKPIEQCRAVCESYPECVQYKLTGTVCTTTGSVMLGYAKAALTPEDKPVTSGWLMDRVDAAITHMATCDPNKPVWMIPPPRPAPVEAPI